MRVLVALVVLLASCSTAKATEPGTPSPSPLGAVARDGMFVLEIASPRDRWAGNEPIRLAATLSYEGSRQLRLMGAGSGLIAYTVTELTGSREMGAVRTSDCEPYDIGPDRPIKVDYIKSGAVNPGEPNEAFYEEFFSDPEFRLPAGRWRVEAWARFAVGECGEPETELRAAVVLAVE